MFKKLKETLTGVKDTEAVEAAPAKESKITTDSAAPIAPVTVAANATKPARTAKAAASTDPSAGKVDIHTMKKAGEMELTEEQQKSPMGILMTATAKNPPTIGDLVEGPVISLDKAAVYVDLTPFGTGIIYGREYIIARDVIKKINIGDVIAAKIVDNAHPEGYYELSLKEARQALIWSEAELAIKEKRVLDLPIKEANKGGLLIEW